MTFTTFILISYIPGNNILKHIKIFAEISIPCFSKNIQNNIINT